MILSRIMAHIRAQNWTAVVAEFVVVVLGVFVGLQVNLWNEARVESMRRQQIIDALVTTLGDNIGVQEGFVAEIDAGLADWEAAYARGEMPTPYFYRIDGSDTAPDVWSTFQQMQLTTLFDPVTLFDLMFFYSEVDGVGRKYLRYVTVVEDEILPNLNHGTEAFYDAEGRLRPIYRANMDRLRDYRNETQRLNGWARCLVYRLEADRPFEVTCRRADFRLDGIVEAPHDSGAEPRA